MKQDYVAYEYTSITVKEELKQMYLDYYKYFGWIYINDNKKTDYYINSNPSQDIVNLKFKRNRNIKNKEKLQELQTKCINAILKVNKLEKEPHEKATMYSLITGFMAIVFILLTVLCVTGTKILWIPAILCGLVGLACVVTPYFVYKKVFAKKELENREKIKKEQDIIDNACKEAIEILVENE